MATPVPMETAALFKADLAAPPMNDSPASPSWIEPRPDGVASSFSSVATRTRGLPSLSAFSPVATRTRGVSSPSAAVPVATRTRGAVSPSAPVPVATRTRGAPSPSAAFAPGLFIARAEPEEPPPVVVAGGVVPLADGRDTMVSDCLVEVRPSDDAFVAVRAVVFSLAKPVPTTLWRRKTWASTLPTLYFSAKALKAGTHSPGHTTLSLTTSMREPGMVWPPSWASIFCNAICSAWRPPVYLPSATAMILPSGPTTCTMA